MKRNTGNGAARLPRPIARHGDAWKSALSPVDTESLNQTRLPPERGHFGVSASWQGEVLSRDKCDLFARGICSSRPSVTRRKNAADSQRRGSFCHRRQHLRWHGMTPLKADVPSGFHDSPRSVPQRRERDKSEPTIACHRRVAGTWERATLVDRRPAAAKGLVADRFKWHSSSGAPHTPSDSEPCPDKVLRHFAFRNCTTASTGLYVCRSQTLGTPRRTNLDNLRHNSPPCVRHPEGSDVQSASRTPFLRWWVAAPLPGPLTSLRSRATG